MYNTTDSYKSKIYNVNHFLKVYINDAEIESKYILDCRPSSTLFTNGEIELGSTPSQTVELKLYKSVVPATINKVEIKSGITGEIVPIGIYNVDKAPTSDDYTVTLSLADNMIKFEFNYDGSKLVNDNDGKVKIIRVLQDICSKANVELGSTSFLNMNKVIAVYDNTVSARTYLSYIAEQAGGFAFIGRDGKLYIKSFKYALGKKIGEGKSFVIEKTNNLRAKTVIKGEYSQKTTQGINFLEIALPTQTYRGVTFTNNGDGSFTLNGTATADLDFRVEQNAPLGSNNFNAYKGTYTFYCSNLKSGMWFGSATYDDGAYNFFMGRLQGNVSLLTREVDVGSGFFYIHIVSGTTVRELTLKPMFVKGSYTLETIPDFEPYTGGKPSPSKDYLQEVETVGSNVNLFDKDSQDMFLKGLTPDNTGKIVVGDTDTSGSNYQVTIIVPCLPDSTYIISRYVEGKTFFVYESSKKDLKVGDNVTLLKRNNNTGVINEKITTGANAKYLLVKIYNTYAIEPNTYNDLISSVKVEKGTKATPYSPYGQGSVKITKKNRNLFDIKQINLTSLTGYGVTITLNDDNSITINGTATDNHNFVFQNNENYYLEFFKDKTYSMLSKKISGEATGSLSTHFVSFNKEEKMKWGFLGVTSSGNDAINKATATERMYSNYFVIYIHKGVTYTNYRVKLMVLEGEYTLDTVPEYVDNQTENYIIPIQQEMLEGDYIDSTEHHTWKKLVLDGSEDWGAGSAPNQVSTTYFNSNFDVAKSNSNYSISNYFSYAPDLWNKDKEGVYIDFLHGHDVRIRISKEKASTIDEFKAWLKSKYDEGNPVIVYYKLATPIDLALTEEQKKVLKEIHNMDLYEDYTIIESDTEIQVNFARAEIPFKYFQNFKWGAKYKLSKIRYEDGIRVFEKGDDTGNTLYINPDNMFIVDQDQIDNIYDELKDLELYSFKGDSIVDPALDIGDIVVIDGKQVLYCGSSQYSGRWKASINSEIKSKERQETTRVKKPSQKTINRRVQSSIDQANGKIKQLIEATDETSETLSKHEQTLDGFTNTVSKIEKDVESVKSTANSSVKEVEVKYALGDSSTEAPATGWSTTAPTWTEGKYMWQKTVTTFVDGSVSESNATCIQGAKGADGIDGKDGKDGVNGEKGDKGDKGDVGPQGPQGEQGIQGVQGPAGDKGADGKTTYFHIKYSSVVNPTSSQMTETPSAYIGTYVDYTAEDSTDPAKYTWSRFQGIQGEKGEKGIPGVDGTNGKTSYLHIAYANSADGKTDFDVSDSTNKTYIGQYTDFIEADSTEPTKYSWTKIKGETGQQGKTGATGKGIKSVQDQYYLSTSNIKQTGGAWKNTQDEWEEGKYIWTRSFITWTDNTTSYTTPCLADSINKANQTASDTAKNLENNYSTTKETEAMIQQESDSIRLEVDTIEKFTRDITSRRELHLVDTADYAENLVLTLKIFGDTEKWKELVPSTSLIPGLTVAPLGTTIDLIVDSQSRLNPSEDKQVFTINYGKKLRSLGNVRDELDIINNKVTIIRRIGLNDSGQEYVLQTEQTEELGELKLPTLKDNTYIYIREYPNLEYFCRYITDNEYIKKFATQEGLKEATVNLNTKIEQSNKEIILLARQKVGKDEIIASINISPEEIKILAEKLQISAENVLNILAGNTINLTSRNLIIASKYLNIDEDGNLILNSPGINVFRVKNSRYPNRSIYINDQYIGVNTDGEENCITIGPINDNEGEIELSGNGRSILRASGLTTPTVTQTSTESTKKNFEILKKATDIVKNGDIYGYNLKIENDTDKKHYGFVIADEGGNFKTPEEVISKTGKGIDTYSMISVLWKACQELIIKVEQLENNMK